MTRLDAPGKGSDQIHRMRTYCRPCGKWAYCSRRVAKRAARAYNPGEVLRTYLCPEPSGGYHIGHTPRPIVRGEADPWW